MEDKPQTTDPSQPGPVRDTEGQKPLRLRRVGGQCADTPGPSVLLSQDKKKLLTSFYPSYQSLGGCPPRSLCPALCSAGRPSPGAAACSVDSLSMETGALLVTALSFSACRVEHTVQHLETLNSSRPPLKPPGVQSAVDMLQFQLDILALSIQLSTGLNPLSALALQDQPLLLSDHHLQVSRSTS